MSTRKEGGITESRCAGNGSWKPILVSRGAAVTLQSYTEHGRWRRPWHHQLVVSRMNVFVCATRLVWSEKSHSVFHSKACTWLFIASFIHARPKLESAHQKPCGQTNGGTSTKKEYYRAIKTNDVITWTHEWVLHDPKWRNSDHKIRETRTDSSAGTNWDLERDTILICYKIPEKYELI